LVGAFSGENIKIVATRCHILKLKCTNFDFGLVCAPDPVGGSLQRSPRPPSWISGGLLLRGRRGGEGKGKAGEGKGLRGWAKGGKGEKERGKGRGSGGGRWST